MNYRHAFHAGNFADVFKHVLLAQLVCGLQRKEKGFLYLDTHAGQGAYDLAVSARGDTLARDPEWPDGIGRLWKQDGLPAVLAEYMALVSDFDRGKGNPPGPPRFYPGSPRIAQRLMRPQDRLALCEKQPGECAALRAEFAPVRRATVHEMDGYIAARAMLPPPERRALVLIDPSFEAQDEFSQIIAALRDGLRRLPGGTFAVWHPLTERAKTDDFMSELLALKPPPTLALELTIAGEESGLKMRGCGLVIVNPPWQFDRAAKTFMPMLARLLAQGPGANAESRWLVPE